jgi:hypothetical protein
MSVTELDVEAWRADSTLPEVDFSASAGGSLQISMAALARFPKAMVFTGHLGDLTWTARSRDAHDGFTAPENFSFDAWGQHDFQLRVGVVAIHVPAICGFHGKALGRISCSDEMKPFHLGSPYERPIARRILEEGGAPRDSFGIQKYHGRGLNPTEQLSDAPRRDFDQWWRAFRRNLSPLRRWSYRFEATVVTPSINVMAALLFRLGRGGTARRALRYRQYFWSVPGAYRFHWAVERLIERFQDG